MNFLETVFQYQFFYALRIHPAVFWLKIIILFHYQCQQPTNINRIFLLKSTLYFNINVIWVSGSSKFSSSKGIICNRGNELAKTIGTMVQMTETVVCKYRHSSHMWFKEELLPNYTFIDEKYINQIWNFFLYKTWISKHELTKANLNYWGESTAFVIKPANG